MPARSPTTCSWVTALGRWRSAATRIGVWPWSLSHLASLPARVVLPEPCRPASMMTVGGFLANSTRRGCPPRVVNEELVTILGGQARRVEFAKNPPTVIMLAGLQGSGKTTLAGKLAKWLKDQGHTPILVAADLQRPNAVTQLQVIGQRAGVPVFAPERGNVAGYDAGAGSGDGTRSFGDPVTVCRQGMVEARTKQHDVVIVDTAGRLAIDENLMQQAADIRAAISPDEVLFVIDAMIGQAAVDTALAFQQGVDFTGVVLTKLDGDARGGAAL